MRRSRLDATLSPPSHGQTGFSMTERPLRRLCLAAATIAATLGADAARADDSRRITEMEENDSVLFDSDKFYTQGLEFAYLGPDVEVDSAWIGPFDLLGDLGPFDAEGAGGGLRRSDRPFRPRV